MNTPEPTVDRIEGMDLPALLFATRAESAALLAGQAEEAERAAYLGGLLHELRRREGHTAAGEATFVAFTRALGFPEGEPELYMESRGVPLMHLRGRRIAVRKLHRIARAPAWLQAALCGAVQPSTPERLLDAAIRSSEQKEERGATEAAACAHAVAVLAGRERPLGRVKEQRTVGQHGRSAAAAGRRMLKELEAVLAGRPRDQALQGRWVGQARGVLRELLALGVELGLVDEGSAAASGAAQGRGGGPAVKPAARPAVKPAAGPAVKPAAATVGASAAAAAAPSAPKSAPEAGFAAQERENLVPPEPRPQAAPAAPETAAPTAPAALVTLEELQREWPVVHDGVQYSYTQIGAAFAERLSADETDALTEALYLLLGTNDPASEARGAEQLRRLARAAEGGAGLPPGVLTTWALRCGEPDLETCFPYAFRSLQEFRLGRYRQLINALPVAGMPEPYQSAFLEAAARIPRHERDEWLRSSPADFDAYWAERDRLLRAQVPYREVPSQAEAHVRALRAARAAQRAPEDRAQGQPGERG